MGLLAEARDPSRGTLQNNHSLIRFAHKVFLFPSVLAQANLARPSENKNPTASCGSDLFCGERGIIFNDPQGGTLQNNHSLIRFAHKVFLFPSVLAQASLARPSENKNPAASCGSNLVCGERGSNAYPSSDSNTFKLDTTNPSNTVVEVFLLIITFHYILFDLSQKCMYLCK